MFLRSGSLVLSPTDLSAFLGCRHRTGLDLAVAHGALDRPEWRDAMGEALRARGLAHEQQYVDWLRGQGLAVLDLSNGPDGAAGTDAAPRTDADALALTRGAMQQGVPVIYQALLAGDGWRGYADILRRVETPSALGAWSYEVHDTKLARDTRGGTMLQLVAYSELLAGIQGVWPEQFHVVAPALASELARAPVAAPATGDTAPFLIHRYRLADYTAFYRRVKAQLLDALAEGHAALADGSLSRAGGAVRGVPLVRALQRTPAPRRPPGIHRRQHPGASRGTCRSRREHARRRGRSARSAAVHAVARIARELRAAARPGTGAACATHVSGTRPRAAATAARHGTGAFARAVAGRHLPGSGRRAFRA